MSRISADMVELFRSAAKEQIAALGRVLQEIDAAPKQWETRKAEAHNIAHNLKGQGASFGYPLITSIAQSLLALLRGEEKSAPCAIKVALAHVTALHTILEKNIQGGGGPRGEALVKRLGELTAP
jgi:chemotaxis protein histidine kinase CheA